MNAFRQFYKSSLTRYPVGMQALQTALLMAGGDIIAQTAVEKKALHEIDLQRTGKFGLVGFCIVGPCLRTWYGVLDKKFGSGSGTVALKKVALDQLLFAPCFIVVILTSLGTVQGLAFEEVKRKLFRDYSDVLLNNYKLWPAVQVCNFYLTPIQYQVLVVQVVALLWNIYISWKSSQELTDR